MSSDEIGLSTSRFGSLAGYRWAIRAQAVRQLPRKKCPRCGIVVALEPAPARRGSYRFVDDNGHIHPCGSKASEAR